jgi:hypothetical protein
MRRDIEKAGEDLDQIIEQIKTVRHSITKVEIAIIDQRDVDGMPSDRDELQKMLNDAYRKGSQDAHAAVKLLSEEFSLPISPDPTKDAWNT